MAARASASTTLVRALIFVDGAIDSDLVRGWGETIKADEVILLTTADQDDVVIGRVKVSGREPRHLTSESLLKHVIRAVTSRLGLNIERLGYRLSTHRALLDRVAWFRPDHIYSNVPDMHTIGHQLGIVVHRLA